MTSNEIEALLLALAETPDAIATLAEGLNDAALHQRSAADEFSFIETACHLRDLEREGYGVRIARILDEDHPVLADFDGGAVAAARNYQDEDFRTALGEFGSARSENIERLRGLTPEQFARRGEMEGTGTIALGQLLGMMREHDEIHRNDLVRLRAELAATRQAAG